MGLRTLVEIAISLFRIAMGVLTVAICLGGSLFLLLRIVDLISTVHGG